MVHSRFTSTIFSGKNTENFWVTIRYRMRETSFSFIVIWSVSSFYTVRFHSRNLYYNLVRVLGVNFQLPSSRRMTFRSKQTENFQKNKDSIDNELPVRTHRQNNSSSMKNNVKLYSNLSIIGRLQLNRYN